MSKPQTLDDLENLSDEELMGVSEYQEDPAPIVEPDPSLDPAASPAPQEDALESQMMAEDGEPLGGIVEPLEEGEHDPDTTLEAQIDAAAEAASNEDTLESSANDDHTTPNQTATESDDTKASAPSAEAKVEGAENGEDSVDASNGDDTNSPKPASGESSENAGINKAEAYDQIMAPFKANGRQIKLQSPEEAIRLMQQGANYTRKMQQLAPNLKMMRMLENNGLLNEDKIGFLIDVSKQNPAAIAKLVKDSGVDPMDLDTENPPAYQPGNHTVSDQEMSFSDALGDVMSTQDGKTTVNMINSEWDQASKEAIFKEPNILQIINEQRANGIYDQISAEVERQQTLGTLNRNTPFIQAYKTVGDQMHQQGMLVTQQAQDPVVAPQIPTPVQNPTPAAPKVLGQRPSTVRRSDAADADPRVRAAAPTRSSPSTPNKSSFNVFEMSDEEIMKIAT